MKKTYYGYLTTILNDNVDNSNSIIRTNEFKKKQKQREQ